MPERCMPRGAAWRCWATTCLLGWAGACGDDHEPRDAVPVDASTWVPDAALPSGRDVFEVLRALPAPSAPEPFFLSQTGLYADPANEALSGDALEFAPNFPLWSDGADKRRFLRLPPGSAIDSSDPDALQVPVGTLVFKEFRCDGRPLETRLIARVGPGERDFWMGAFVWDEQGHDARFAPEGGQDVLGTSHDVPSVKQCGACHNGEPGRLLGVSLVQLAGAAPLGLRELSARGLLTVPPSDALAAGLSADEATRQALGYLHANCGHCHNPRGSARPDTDLNLRLSPGVHDPLLTPTYRTSVGAPLQNFVDPAARARVVPGDPEHSGVLLRMKQRGAMTQMPPIATEQVDQAGAEMVSAWIRALR